MFGKIFSVPTSAGGIRVFKTTITQAQYRACKTTPITLIAAPGTGKTINPIGGVYLKCSNVGGFNFGGGTTAIGWSSTSNYFNLTGGSDLSGSILGCTAVNYNLVGGEVSNEAENVALVLATYGGTDSAVGTGTVTISFLYSILDNN